MEPVVAWLFLINLVTAAAYAYDKLAAPRSMRRVRERTLWVLCFAGGVVGAWVVFLGMRHKTQHQSFWIVQTAASILWGLLLVVLVTR